MPVDSLAEFILYITPGFIAIEVYRYYFPGKKRNSFTQIAQSVIWALVIINFIRFIDDTYLNNSLHSDQDGVPDAQFSIALLLGGFVFGFLGAYQLKIRSFLSSKYENLSWLSSQPDSIWQQINSTDIEDYVVVYLDDGSIYFGWISNYQADPNSEDQDFLLKAAKRIDDDFKELYLIDGIGVYLNTRDVKRIEFFKGK